MNNALTYMPVAQQSALLTNFGRGDAVIEAPVRSGLPSSKLTSGIERPSIHHSSGSGLHCQARPPEDGPLSALR